MITVTQTQTKSTAERIVQVLRQLASELRSQDPLARRRLQNLLRHGHLIDRLLTGTLKRLAGKEQFLRELFQATVDFFYELCLNNPSCQ